MKTKPITFHILVGFSKRQAARGVWRLDDLLGSLYEHASYILLGSAMSKASCKVIIKERW